MGERKVLNKYYPPDFDPELLPRNKRPRDKQILVRIMLPMSIRCTMCGEFMRMGKKFNAKSEIVQDEDYLGIRIHRFFIKCVNCSGQITFKTDPKNTDYVTEHGCTRNFEHWKEKVVDEDAAENVGIDPEADPMKALEEQTKASKREMDMLDTLDELKALNSRHKKVDTEALLASYRHTNSGEDVIEHETESRKDKVIKIADELDTMDDEESRRKRLQNAGFGGFFANNNAKAKSKLSQNRSQSEVEGNTETSKHQARSSGPPAPQGALGRIVVQSQPKAQADTNALSGLADYGSSSDSD